MNGHRERPEAPDAVALAVASEDYVLIARSMIEQCRRELKRPRRCATFKLAVAWVVGKHACGCPYESAGPTFEEACIALFGDSSFVEIVRNKLLVGIEREVGRQCRAPSKSVLPLSPRGAHWEVAFASRRSA